MLLISENNIVNIKLLINKPREWVVVNNLIDLYRYIKRERGE